MVIRNVIKERIEVIFKEFFGVKNLKKIDVAFSKVAYNNDNEVAICETVDVPENATSAEENNVADE
jgi:hypothetical protein